MTQDNLEKMVQEAVMDKEIRPCPFCGGKAECFKDKLNEWSVICYDEYNDYDCCEVETSKYPTYQSAVDAWNARITDPLLTALY